MNDNAEMIQFKVTSSMKREISQYCKDNGLSVSVFLRLAIQKVLNQNKPPLDTLGDLGLDKENLSMEKEFYLRDKTEMEVFKKDLREMKATIKSIVDYIKQRELKQMHSDLHPRENQK